MTFSQPIHGSRKPIRGCSAPPPNRRDGWSWLLGWVSYGETFDSCPLGVSADLCPAGAP